MFLFNIPKTVGCKTTVFYSNTSQCIISFCCLQPFVFIHFITASSLALVKQSGLPSWQSRGFTTLLYFSRLFLILYTVLMQAWVSWAISLGRQDKRRRYIISDLCDEDRKYWLVQPFGHGRAGKSFIVRQILVYNCLIRYRLKLHTDFWGNRQKKEVVSESVEFSVAVHEKRVSCAEKQAPRIVCNYEYTKCTVPPHARHQNYAKYAFLKYLYLNNHNSYLYKNLNIVYQIVKKAFYKIKKFIIRPYAILFIF